MASTVVLMSQRIKKARRILRSEEDRSCERLSDVVGRRRKSVLRKGGGERKERERRGEGETSGRMRGGKRFVLCVGFSFSRVQKSRQVEDERGGGLSPSLTVARGPALTQQPLVQPPIPGLECYSSSFLLSLSPSKFSPFTLDRLPYFFPSPYLSNIFHSNSDSDRPKITAIALGQFFRLNAV